MAYEKIQKDYSMGNPCVASNHLRTVIGDTQKTGIMHCCSLTLGPKQICSFRNVDEILSHTSTINDLHSIGWYGVIASRCDEYRPSGRLSEFGLFGIAVN